MFPSQSVGDGTCVSVLHGWGRSVEAITIQITTRVHLIASSCLLQLHLDLPPPLFCNRGRFSFGQGFLTIASVHILLTMSLSCWQMLLSSDCSSVICNTRNPISKEPPHTYTFYKNNYDMRTTAGDYGRRTTAGDYDTRTTAGDYDRRTTAGTPTQPIVFLLLKNICQRC